MADDFDAILSGGTPRTPSGSEPVLSGAKKDEFDAILEGTTTHEFDQALEGKPAPTFGEHVTNILGTAGGGVARNIAQWHAMPYSLEAIRQEAQGNLPGAIDYATEAKKKLDAAGDSSWDLTKIHNPTDFAYWVAEKLGEQSVTALATLGAGIIGGKVGEGMLMGANALSQQLLSRSLITEGSVKAMQLAGMTVPTYAMNTAMETAGTSQEQYDVTGGTQPERSIYSGLAKGALESIVPFTVGRALLTPGLQLGKTLPGAIGKLAGMEGLTEAAQEAVDIYARQLAEPGYSYFKNGPTLMPSGWGEGMWRILESGAAGALVGGVMGAPFAHYERVQERRAAMGGPEGQTLIPPGSEPRLPQESRGPYSPYKSYGEYKASSANIAGDNEAFPKLYPEVREALRDRRQFISAKSLYEQQQLGATKEELLQEIEMRSSWLSKEVQNKLGPGPVTQLRKMVIPPGAEPKLPQESRAKGPRDDALSVGPLISTLPRQTRERFLDLVEANTPRFVELGLDGRPGNRLWTDTELELEHAVNRPQSEQPKLLRVDQGWSLQPAAITAHISDLPLKQNSERIWFVNGVNSAQQQALRQQYAQLFPETAQGAKLALVNAQGRQEFENSFKPLYDQLLTKGLRVVPSRGAGFYYNGTISGEPVENLKSTNRSTEIGLYNPMDGKITKRFMAEDINFDLSNGGIIVSLDMNKLKKEDYDRLSDNSIRLKRPLSFTFTPGIRIPGMSQVDIMTFPVNFVGTTTATSIMGVHPWNYEKAQGIQKEVNKIAPVVDRILRSLGIEHSIFIQITDNRPPGVNTVTPASIHVGDGALYIYPETFDNYIQGSTATKVLDIMMHELGHQVTYYYYRNLPVEQMEALHYAWKKSLLAVRMGDASHISNATAIAAGDESNTRHWSTFPEWLAEQFRRWATSDEQVVGWLDKSYKDGARQLEKYFIQWEKQFGKQTALNLTQPSANFSAWMQYLRDFGSERELHKQLLKQNTLYSVGQSLMDSPAKFQVLKQVDMALRSMQDMVPAEINTRVNEALDPHIVPGMQLNASQGARARFIPDAALIELSIGAMTPESALGQTRQVYAHELWHAYEGLGIVSSKEIELLMRDIKGKERTYLTADSERTLHRYIREQGALLNLPAGQTQAWFERMRDQELRAYYLQSFADTGIAHSGEGKTILSRIIAYIERIKNFLKGLGFQTREDVLRAFFNGEMVARHERSAKRQENGFRSDHYAMYAMEPIDQSLVKGIQADQEWKVGNYTVKAIYDQMAQQKTDAPNVFYYWINPTGKLDGYLEMNNKMPKGFEVSWIQSEAFTLAPQMLQHAEMDLGIKMKFAAEFTEEGYKQAGVMARFRKQEGVLGLYTKITVQDAALSTQPITFWISPLELKARYDRHVEMLKKPKLRQQFGLSTEQVGRATIYYKKLLDKMPANVWEDPRLAQMFNLDKNYKRDEVQGAMVREGQQVEESKLLASMNMGSELQDVYANAFDVKQKLSQAEQAKASGLSFDLAAPRSMLTYESRKIWERVTGYGGDPQMDRHMHQRAQDAFHEMDRIGKFTKGALGWQQLVWSNEQARDFDGARMLTEHMEMSSILSQSWLDRAGETARAWMDISDVARKEGITNTFFGLSEMNYRLPSEVAAGTVRMPSNWNEFLLGQPPIKNGELERFFKKNGLQTKDYEIVRRVSKDFTDFLTAVEFHSDQVLQRKFANSPEAYTIAKAKMDKDLLDMRAKPYFPSMRFGQFTLSVKDGGKVIWSSAYMTQGQREAAIPSVRKQFPSQDMFRGKVPENALEFQSLPGPLLRVIKENLFDKSDMTPEQIAVVDKQLAWIEEFELQNAPDRTFKKRWMPATGIPGHSMDTFRAYSHYFGSGARYLGRMAYYDLMQEDLKNFEGSVQRMPPGSNTAKRQELVNYAKTWFRYIMEPGRDHGKFRAFFNFWYLAYSPAAAGTNLTQTMTATIPWLMGHFGNDQGLGAIMQTINALKETNGYSTGSPSFMLAKQEMKRQGLLDQGRAAEIGAGSEGWNLHRLMSVTKLQRFWRMTNYYGMFLFQAAEHFNREFAMKATWDLAMKNPKIKRLQEIDLVYPLQVADLMKRVGLTHQEAITFLFAKEGIKRTQGVYDKSSDPPFMRGKKKDIFIFFKYTQTMIYAFGKNGAMAQMALIYMFLYGLNGLPGSEDAQELLGWLESLGRSWFGKDFHLRKKAREFVVSATQGTPFEEVGPDLAMHGISRYGFGLGLLPQGYGIPRFDASANGSMGKVVPGLAEMMHGLATGAKMNDIVADTAQRAAGAGYGSFFALMQFLMDKPSPDSHKWEQILQREMKALAKAYRYGVNPQAETTRQGGKIVRFSATDPDDVATVIAQALGFSPTKVQQTWEMMRAGRELGQEFDARRQALYVQMDRAIREGNQQVIEDVIKAVNVYNDEVVKINPLAAIKPQALIGSLKQREKIRIMQEMFLASDKKGMLYNEAIKDQYPGVKPQVVK